MSSFILDKKKFIKAAGIMCGIEESKRDKHQYFIDNVKRRFEECYELNVDSVNEQYCDNNTYDNCAYQETFDEYRAKGMLIYNNMFEVDGVKVGVKWLRPRMLKFFQSVLYQIENEECANIVGHFFFVCMSKLSDGSCSDIEGWWGEIEI